MSKITKEFKEFIMRGNVMDMAVGVIVGGAFSSIINSLVNDVLMPVISLATGKVDFTNLSSHWTASPTQPWMQLRHPPLFLLMVLLSRL